MLYSRGEVEGACYTRGALETDTNNPEIAATVFDLLRVFRDILERQQSAAEMEIERDEMTIGEKLAQIRALIAVSGEISVREVFELAGSKRDLILTFLAFLELVKEGEISLIQQRLFGEIIARKRVVTAETPRSVANLVCMKLSRRRYQRRADELKPAIEAVFVPRNRYPSAVLQSPRRRQRRRSQSRADRTSERIRERGGGLDIREIAGGWRFSTRAQFHEFVRKYLKTRPSARLSLRRWKRSQ